MKHKWRWLWIILLIGMPLVLAVVTPAGAPKSDLPSPPRPGLFNFVVHSGGYDRVAHVHIPAGYTPASKPPLVVLLHGGGGSGISALQHNGWDAKADAEGFIVVAPDGLPAAPRLRGNFKLNPVVWNSGQFPANAPRSAIDDVEFIRQLLDELQDRVPYDANRVFAAGHSNGGGMTLRLAAELSERFAAVGMVAGLMAIENPKPTKPLPTLYIIGTKDPLMPVEGGEVKTPWGKRQNRPIAELLAKWAVAIGCAPEPVTIADDAKTRRVEYPSTNDGPTLTAVYLEGHGHHWPGGKRSLPNDIMGPDTAELNATDTLWEFFSSVRP